MTDQDFEQFLRTFTVPYVHGYCDAPVQLQIDFLPNSIVDVQFHVASADFARLDANLRLKKAVRDAVTTLGEFRDPARRVSFGLVDRGP